MCIFLTCTNVTNEDSTLFSFDIIEYLKEKEETEATLEVLSSHELAEQIEEAERSLKKGQLKDFIPWEKVKRHV